MKLNTKHVDKLDNECYTITKVRYQDVRACGVNL